MQFIIIFLMSFSAYAKIEVPNPKWDFEIYEAGLKYKNGGYPPKKIENAYWLPIKDTVPKSFRYMHALVVSAFYSQRADQVELSLSWLEKYQCENRMACEEYQRFLDGAIKENILTLDKKSKQRVTKLRDQIDVQVKAGAMKWPAQLGLCAEGAELKQWLEQGYQMYCPAFKIETSDSKAGFVESTDEPLSATHAMLQSMSRFSHQDILSSNYIVSFKHLGFQDCEKPWKVQMECWMAGSQPVYKYNCKKTGASFPFKVTCTK